MATISEQTLVEKITDKVIERLNRIEEPLTIEETAKFLKRSKSQLSKLVKETDIPYFMFDSKPTFLKNELINWIKQHNMQID